MSRHGSAWDDEAAELHVQGVDEPGHGCLLAFPGRLAEEGAVAGVLWGRQAGGREVDWHLYAWESIGETAKADGTLCGNRELRPRVRDWVRGGSGSPASAYCRENMTAATS